MNTRKAILLITLVMPGLAVVGISLYWFILDYDALGKAENNVERLAKNAKLSYGQLDYAYHRTLAHRINVFADGTWGLLGGVITAIGIHGLATVREQNGSKEKSVSDK
ncbi:MULTISPECIES: hypothetical protein [unclassified Tolypothrix]|uniref:hypothetical protein n=1 Tax=unclassified Tolypothrix TaxID=2649714 RepID=UPI0005EAAEEC|nr:MULTISPECIES: hypothetical protein [unclassified Tolypothrix]BAY94986.1 hypothetical protein NIES3275_70430 [Microchaete diplosiphon NIES-3275]EKF00730.1 hypothetical protein FDUTEX481_08880 [Tolypothrix sp. PCC 7601]MBE9086734.1 hypothetical protein [Tolypothrix sp. LEGE 11397]UYD28620.1 hypothetical protein HGR01_11640 [Tolypothrix sp. PCC 7712]UYD35471.1 hypothetical protein HG267_06735 [Tolypothrix sp. PCC 7601]